MKKCHLCNISFSRKRALDRHLLSHQHSESTTSSSKQRFFCSFCSDGFSKRKDLRFHVSTEHEDLLVFRKKSAINDRVCIFTKDLSSEKQTLADFCNSKKSLKEIFNLIKTELMTRTVFRASIVISASYEISDLSSEGGPVKSSDNDTFSLRSKGLVFNELEGDRRIQRKISRLLQGALAREEDLLTRGSGWRFENLEACDILLYDVCFVATKPGST